MERSINASKTISIQARLAQVRDDPPVRMYVKQHASVMMDAEQLEWLAACIASGPWDSATSLVEIGTWIGQTSVFCMRVLDRFKISAPILSIDPFERAEAEAHNCVGSLPAWRECVYRAGGWRRCFPLVGRSQDVAPLVSDGIGVLIIDGSHQYEAALADLTLYTPKVVPGGFVVLDDTAHPYDGVVAALDTWLAGAPPVRLIHRGGFAVLQRLETP